MGHVSSMFTELTFGGRTIQACLSKGVLEGDSPVPFSSLRGAIPLADDGSNSQGFIKFFISFTDDIAQVTTDGGQILRTLSINFR